MDYSKQLWLWIPKKLKDDRIEENTNPRVKQLITILQFIS